MTFEEFERQRTERLANAVKLLESHPNFASVQVQVHERTDSIARDVPWDAENTGTDARLSYILEIFDAHGEAYLLLIGDVETQKAVMVFLEEIAQRSWEQFTGFPCWSIQATGDTQLARLQARMRHWTVEGWKRLDGHNAKVSDSQGHAGSKKAPVVRRGYRSEVLAWMKRTGMENIRQAAKRLGVSVSTLKSIMSERGQQRYGPDTLDEVLKKIGYHQG